MKILLAFFLTLVLSVPEPTITALHDFHLSRTRIEYAAAQQEWQISLHIFIDDLSLALQERGAPNLRLGTKSELADADVYIQKYLRQFLQFETAGTTLSWEWLGKETSEDLSAFHIYLFLPQAEPNLPLKLKNQLLLDIYDDQQNMVQFIGPDKEARQLLLHQDLWETELISSSK
jgi:hypothetical protein